MILGLGLMTSVYLVFLVLPGALSTGSSKLKNHMVGRTATLVIVIYLLFIMDSLLHWHGDVVFIDGLCKINSSILTSEIYILVLILAILHLQAIYSRRPELYLLILSNVLGLIYMISSNDWLITVTAWELFNLSLYLLTSVNCESEAALSAAIKYFLLSALTTTFLLLAVALLYAITGGTHYDSISLSLTMEPSTWPILLMLIPFLLKLGAAPLHNVSIDLYDAVPTPITVYLINISKLAVLLFLMQITPLWSSSVNTHMLLIIAGMVSMLVGSIGLGSQFKIKRFLTYSSISHLGFMLLALSSLQMDSFLYYAFIYFLNSITIFAILLALGQIMGREILFIHQLAGLWKMNIPLALVLTLSIFSLAGIPPLSGFFAKLMVLEAYLSQGWFTITLLAILASVISSANYLGFIKTSLFDQGNVPHASSTITRPLTTSGAKGITPSVAYLVTILFTISILFILKPASLLILSTQLLTLDNSTTLLAIIPIFILPRKVEDFGYPGFNILRKVGVTAVTALGIILIVVFFCQPIYCAGEFPYTIPRLTPEQRVVHTISIIGTSIGVGASVSTLLKHAPRVGASAGLVFGGICLGYYQGVHLIADNQRLKEANLVIKKVAWTLRPSDGESPISLGWLTPTYNGENLELLYLIFIMLVFCFVTCIFMAISYGLQIFSARLLPYLATRPFLLKVYNYLIIVSKMNLIIYYLFLVISLFACICGLVVVLFYTV